MSYLKLESNDGLKRLVDELPVNDYLLREVLEILSSRNVYYKPQKDTDNKKTFDNLVDSIWQSHVNNLKLELQTEVIVRDTEMYSLLTSKKHKIQYRFTVTAIQREDNSIQYALSSKNDMIDRTIFENESVIKAIREVEHHIRKNLNISKRD